MAAEGLALLPMSTWIVSRQHAFQIYRIAQERRFSQSGLASPFTIGRSSADSQDPIALFDGKLVQPVQIRKR
jgi:hypothetical protein